MDYRFVKSHLVTYGVAQVSVRGSFLFSPFVQEPDVQKTHVDLCTIFVRVKGVPRPLMADDFDVFYFLMDNKLQSLSNLASKLDTHIVPSLLTVVVTLRVGSWPFVLVPLYLPVAQ